MKIINKLKNKEQEQLEHYYMQYLKYLQLESIDRKLKKANYKTTYDLRKFKCYVHSILLPIIICSVIMVWLQVYKNSILLNNLTIVNNLSNYILISVISIGLFITVCFMMYFSTYADITKDLYVKIKILELLEETLHENS